MKKVLSLLLVLVLLFCLIPTAFAASEEAQGAADKLHTLGLFHGKGTNDDGTPIYALDSAPTRNEAVTMLVRLLGKEEEANAGTWDIPFTDVLEWAKPYVGYAYANGLTSGTSATTFSGSKTITATQYLTFVLRALGYDSSTDFQWNAAWELTDALGITKGEYNADTAVFTRGDVAQISVSALSANMKGAPFTMAEKLIGEGVFTEQEYDAVIHASAAGEVSQINYYKLFDYVASSWEEAEQYCESLGGHLATITSEEENDYIFQLVRDADFTSAYFGLTDRDVEGTWAWITGEPVSYTNWHPGEPNDENSTEDYAMYYFKFDDGTWNDGDFGGKTDKGGIAFICEWDSESAYEAYLKEKNAASEIPGVNFYEVFELNVTSWVAAEQYCESLGGHLATLTSKEENAYVYQLMRKAGYTSAYFGLTDKDDEGTWVWITGEPVSYTNWHPGEPNNENPNEDYSMFYFKFDDGTWNDGDFGGRTDKGGIAFICEWDTEEAYNSYQR